MKAVKALPLILSLNLPIFSIANDRESGTSPDSLLACRQEYMQADINEEADPENELAPNGGQQGLTLADFIRANTDQIVAEWQTFARTLKPASDSMTPLALRDHIQEILAFIVKDIESPQTSAQQIQKSQGGKERDSAVTAAETHAALRLAGGFDIDQMVSEYRALRASVIKLWSRVNTQMNSAYVKDLTRFNESIDQELAESVSHYTHKVAYSKDLFVGILSHELRNPLNVIAMSAKLMLSIGAPTERHTMLASQIVESTTRITTLVDDLLDMTRARFGAGLPVLRVPMDMEFVCQKIVDEMRSKNPSRTLNLMFSGDGKGEWDKPRIAQILANLIGNAIQYGFKDSSVVITVTCEPEDIIISVHNKGVPIPPEKMGTLFDALSRAVIDTGEHPGAVNLGLGLYITKEIVVSHNGTIDVASTEEDGTTFTVRLPRSV